MNFRRGGLSLNALEMTESHFLLKNGIFQRIVFIGPDCGPLTLIRRSNKLQVS